MSKKIIKSKKTEKCIISHIEEDFIRIDVQPNMVVDKKDIDDNYNIYSAFLDNKPALFLVVFGEGVTATEDARTELANLKRDEIKIAEAGVVPSVVTRVMVKMFMAFFKPNHPIKMFTNEEEAMEWLVKFRKPS